MKKYFFIVAMFLSLISLSCDKIPFFGDHVIERPMIDWAPITLQVFLMDDNGNNLLDPENENYYDPSNIAIKYEGKVYRVTDPNSPQTLAYRAQFGKIFIGGVNGMQYLEISEFNATEKCEMRKVEIVWGDGTTDVIAYTNDYSVNDKYANDADKNWGYTFYRQAYINGEKNTKYDGKSRNIGYTIYKTVPDDIIVDWMPIIMNVYLHDEEGRNLLDQDFADSYDLSNIVIKYNGEEYAIRNQDDAQPLYYLASFGELWYAIDSNNEAYIEIGEWDVLEKCEMCSVDIVWGDGTTDTLAFSNDYTYDAEYRNDSEHNFGYTFTRSAYLNGVRLSDDEYNGSIYIPFNIVK